MFKFYRKEQIACFIKELGKSRESRGTSLRRAERCLTAAGCLISALPRGCSLTKQRWACRHVFERASPANHGYGDLLILAKDKPCFLTFVSTAVCKV